MSDDAASKATHFAIVVDRSANGLKAAVEMLETCPQLEERMQAWHASDDALFLFFMEQGSGRISSVTARDVDDMVSEVLPHLFGSTLAPPAVVSLAIVTAEPAFQSISDCIRRLAIRA